jgi:hypothetical protein
MPPYHVQTLEDYWHWLDSLIGGSGGYLEPVPYLEVELLERWGDFVGLTVPRQRLVFHDGTFLSFEMTVAKDDLEPVDYSFHFQHEDGRFRWRKDRHDGHERELGCREHIHDNPKDPDKRRRFEIVEMDEVLYQVAQFQQSGE